MDKRKHRRSRRFLSALMVLAMLVSLLPAGAFAQSGTPEQVKPVLNISNSKTATNLAQNEAGDWQSQVMLSLPAADYQKEIDVVFVIDDTSAGSRIWTEAATKFLDELRKKENLDIKLGLVTFDAVSRDWLEVTTGGNLKGCVSISDEDNHTAIVEALNTELSSSGEGKAKKLGGSNTEWAIDYATEMLNYEGHSDDQYMIVFSDMFGYVYRGNLTVDGTTYYDVPLSKLDNGAELGTLCTPDPLNDTWDDLNAGRGQDKAEYDSFFRYRVDKTDTSTWENYWPTYQNVDSAPDVDDALAEATDAEYSEVYLTPFEKSTYLTYDNIIDAAVNGINVTVVNNNFNPGDHGETIIEIKDGMLNDLVENRYINLIRRDLPHGNGFDESMLPEIFDQLEDELIQVVGTDSYVIDEMGKDFDFVKDSAPILKVEDETLVSESISQEKLGGATCGWTYSSESEPEKARFELYYYGEAGKFGDDDVAADSLVWKTNEDITKENIVSLQYTIQLTEPSEDPGTFGEYDKDGDGILDNDNGEPLGTKVKGIGLATNEVATIYPIDSEGNVGDSVDFPLPTVSYTIPQQIVSVKPADVTIYMGGDNGYTAVVGDEDPSTSENGGTSNSLPEPLFYIEVPDVTELDTDALRFENPEREGIAWTAELAGQDSEDKNLYRLLPEEPREPDVRVQYTYGDQTYINDTFDPAEQEELFRDYEISIYYGENEATQISATYKNKSYTVSAGTGTLRVRAVNDVGNTEDTNPVHDIQASAPTSLNGEPAAVSKTVENTKFYLNNTTVPVSEEGVGLLFDTIIEDGLEEGESRTQALQDKVDETMKSTSETRAYEARYLDLVDADNGNAWVRADQSVKVTWAYPARTDSSTEFALYHFKGLHRDNASGGNSGFDIDAVDSITPEEVTIETTGAGIEFEVGSGGFSPFVLVWDEASNDNPGGPVIVPDDPDEEDPDTPPLNTEDHYSYIVGYPEDYRTGEVTDDESLWPVKPQGNITRAEVATIFYRLLTNDARDENWTKTNSFTDVSADSWYNTPVSTLSAMGILEGYEDGSFRPNASITRAEFAAIAGRFFVDNEAIYEPGTFSDIQGAEWFADAVQAAKDHDIIGGYPDGSFKPNNPITRAEACSIVNRTTKRVPDADHLLAEDQMRNWPDNANTEAWYYADMQEATNGHYYDYILDDNEEIVREEWSSAREPIDWDAVEAELEASH